RAARDRKSPTPLWADARPTRPRRSMLFLPCRYLFCATCDPSRSRYSAARAVARWQLLMQPIRVYACGFLFSADRAQVLLIRKRRPVWQCGKFNGIGGKLEAAETPLEA